MTAFVGQERIGNPVRGREISQDLDGVVADREQRYTVGGQVGRDVLQLDELRLAERSPFCAAVEHHQSRPTRSLLVQVDQPARLVG
jgi:hypothetical protein